MKPDLYKILDVEKEADKETIKKAFRKKAYEHHPDVGGSSEEFHRITLAYKTLTDDSKRKKYDQTGDVDDDAKPTLRNKAIHIIIDKFSKVLNEIPPSDLIRNDLISIIKNSVLDDIRNFKNHRRKIGKQITYIHMVKSRLKKKSGEGDFLLNFLNRSKEQHKDNLLRIQENMELSKLVMSLLDDYEFIHEDIAPVVMTTSSTSAYSWG